jgi:hypothetical protein
MMTKPGSLGTSSVFLRAAGGKVSAVSVRRSRRWGARLGLNPGRRRIVRSVASPAAQEIPAASLAPRCIPQCPRLADNTASAIHRALEHTIGFITG